MIYLPKPGIAPARGRMLRSVRDAFTTYDQATYDSAGAFLVGELERLDPMVHEPLVSVTWDRDIDIRTDVQMGDESSSYTTQSFGSTGGAAPAGISWAGKETTTLPRVNVDIQKIVNPLLLWAEDVSYTIPELASAQQLGRPIDTQMIAALNLKHQMDIDQMVYVGDPSIGASATGLVNAATVVNTGNVAAGQSGGLTWSSKAPDEILADTNEILVSAWAASGYKAPPTKLLLSPVAFGYLSSIRIGDAASASILKYVRENNIFTQQMSIDLDILPCKWLDKANLNGPAGTPATYDRMVAYTQRPDYIRFPMVPLQTTMPQFRGIWIVVPYYGRLGRVEVVYPETVAFRDGIA